MTAAAIRDEFARALGLDSGGTNMALLAVCKAVGDAVSPGQINQVRGQLPADMKELFPLSAG